MVGVRAAGCNRRGVLTPGQRFASKGPRGPVVCAPAALARDYRGVSRNRSSSLSVPRMKNVLGSIVRS